MFVSVRGRLRLTLAALAILVCGVVGCKQFILLGYIIGGPPSISPEFCDETGEDFSNYDVTVAVVCFAPDTLKWDFHAIDRELAKFVSFRLVEHHVQVVNPEAIAEWMDRNDDWDSPAEIGEQFQADFVVYIDLVKYNLYEENSQNLYRGRSESLVSVYKMDPDGGGEEIFDKEVISTYPIRAPRSTSDLSYEAFKAEYLQRLSEQIGRLFYEHYLADDIGAAS
jgi:hypothetical protein